MNQVLKQIEPILLSGKVKNQNSISCLRLAVTAKHNIGKTVSNPSCFTLERDGKENMVASACNPCITETEIGELYPGLFLNHSKMHSEILS